MHVRKLKDGEVFIEEGAKDNALHLLASGELMVTKKVAGGDSVNLQNMKVGELAGAMGFVDGIARSVTLHAVGDAVVYSLERDAFEPLVGQHPRLVYGPAPLGTVQLFCSGRPSSESTETIS